MKSRKKRFHPSKEVFAHLNFQPFFTDNPVTLSFRIIISDSMPKIHLSNLVESACQCICGRKYFYIKELKRVILFALIHGGNAKHSPTSATCTLPQLASVLKSSAKGFIAEYQPAQKNPEPKYSPIFFCHLH